MERIAARKLARDLEDRGILPANQVRGSRPGTCTWKNATAFTDGVYEGSQRNEQAVAVAIDLEDAYNRVQFKLLIDMLMQYGVCLTLTRWIDCRSASGENSGYTAWKLLLISLQ